MEDVARRAGVSTATVSRTLRGLPYVSEQTRSRVLAAARELSYVVSPMASRLATGRTHTVGVIVPYAARWFFGQIVAGVESVLREAGLDLLLYNLPDLASRQRFFEHQPLRRRVDALVAVAMQLSEAEAAVLRHLAVPMVLVGDTLPGAASVRIDDLEGARRGAGHLADLGHQRIGMITTYVDPSPWPRVARDRRRGYLDVLAKAGLAADPRLVVSIPHGLQGGRTAMSRLLDLDEPPTAVFAESDELAFGALTALRRAGVSVPSQLSIVGFDDHELSELLELTTIRQSVFEQGVLAAHLLDRALREPDWEPVDVLLPTTLVVRSTTAPPVA